MNEPNRKKTRVIIYIYIDICICWLTTLSLWLASAYETTPRVLTPFYVHHGNGSPNSYFLHVSPPVIHNLSRFVPPISEKQWRRNVWKQMTSRCPESTSRFPEPLWLSWPFKPPSSSSSSNQLKSHTITRFRGRMQSHDPHPTCPPGRSTFVEQECGRRGCWSGVKLWEWQERCRVRKEGEASPSSVPFGLLLRSSYTRILNPIPHGSGDFGRIGPQRTTQSCRRTRAPNLGRSTRMITSCTRWSVRGSDPFLGGLINAPGRSNGASLLTLIIPKPYQWIVSF